MRAYEAPTISPPPAVKRVRWRWPFWLRATLLLLALLLFVVPSFDSSGTLLKSQNLLPVVVLGLLVARAPHLRFPGHTVASWLLLGVPLLLLIQGISTVLIAAGVGAPRLGLEPAVSTLLKQVRDPLGAWLVFVLLLGHHRLLLRRNFTTRSIHLMMFAGALALLLFYRLATSWASGAYANPRGFLAGFEGPNSLGAAVALIIPFCVAAIVQSRSKRGWLLNIASLGVLGVLLLLSGSRGAVVALFASGVIALISAFLLGHRATMKQWLIAPVAVVAITALAVVAPSGPVARLMNTDVTNLATDLSTSRRVVQLVSALELFDERPLLGWGFGGYEGGYAKLNPGVAASTTPHNALLLVAVQGGVLAVLVLLGYYALLAVLGLQVYLRRGDTWGIAALCFPLCLAFLDLFFPYTLTHDVGTIAAMFMVSLHLMNRKPVAPA